jgi:hypothetical protein
VQELPAALQEGAFATVLVSWVHEPGAEWAPPLREWLEGSGCDAWLLHYKTEDPLTHTANWNTDAAEHDDDVFEETLDRWLAYFAGLGIEAIAHGAVILRRRSAGPNWVREDELPGDRLGAASDHIMRVFAAQDALAAGLDVLGQRIALAPRARLEQAVVLHDGSWAVESAILSLDEGLGFRAAIDVPTAQLLAELDGKRSVGEVAGPLAEAVRPIAEQLLGLGFLVSR